MQRAYDFLKGHTYFIATEEGDQARVRPFGSLFLHENKLYISTTKEKKVYEQLKNRGAGEFVLFLIQPVTGEFTFIPLNAGDFNPETGEILVKLPFLGVFALVEL